MAAKNLLERLLSPAEVRLTVPASPDAIYAVLDDPDTYAEWLKGAQHVRRLDGEGRAMAYDPPKHLEMELHAGPVRGMLEFELERIGEGTLVTLRETTTGTFGYAMPVLRSAIFLRNKASLEKLRRRFEPLVVRL
jgi:uncharacterized protein YndB with AHSA1/START domain